MQIVILPQADFQLQTPQQLHPLGTRRDSGGHWDRKSPLLGSLFQLWCLERPVRLHFLPYKTRETT